MSSRWTSKIMSKASKLGRKDSASSVDNPNVNDFLYGNSGPPPQHDAILSGQQPMPLRPQPAAVLDLEDNDNGLGEPLPPTNPMYSLRPIRRQKGLKVNFTADQPILIGEGGDEAILPASDVMKHTNTLAPLLSRTVEPPAIVVPDSSLGDADATTGERAIGLGFLQKRRSFNMEEGMIQSQRQVSNSSTMPRQAYGASLEPSSANQSPLQAMVPQPSVRSDSFIQRQQPSLPQVLRAAPGNAESSKSEASESPIVTIGKRWDELPTHSEMQPQTRMPLGSRSPVSTVPQILPSQSGSALPGESRADPVDDASLPQNAYPRPSHPLPLPSPTTNATAATIASPRQTGAFQHSPPLQMSQSRSAPPLQFKPRPVLNPPNLQSPGSPPTDAFAGGVTHFQRGSSPQRTAITSSPPVNTSGISEARTLSPTESVHSVGSSLASTIDNLWAPSQDFSLSDQWGLGGVYRPSGMRSPVVSPPMQSPVGSPQTSAIQQFSRPFNKTPQPPGQQPSLLQQSQSSPSAQHGQTPSLTREPTLPILPPETLGLDPIKQIPDMREPTLPIAQPSASLTTAVARRPSAEPNQERPNVFAPKADHDPPLSPTIAQTPPLEGFSRLEPKVSPPVPSHIFSSKRKDQNNSVGSETNTPDEVLGQVANSNSMTQSQANSFTSQRSEAFRSAPNQGLPAVYPHDKPSRKSSKDALDLPTGNPTISRNLGMPATRSGSTSASSPAEPCDDSKVGVQSGEKAPMQAAPVPSTTSPHMESVHSPQTSQFPPTRLSSVSSRVAHTNIGEQRVQGAPRNQAVEDYEHCIEALAPAFTHAEQQARILVRPKAFLWLRVASWWSLKGRKGFEAKIKQQFERGGPQSGHVDEALLQPFVDVSKAWWIIERILPEILGAMQPQSPSELGGLHGMALQQVFQALKVQVETFVSSVTRRRLLPSPELLVSNLHVEFLVSYPSLPATARTVTAGYSPSVAMPGSNRQPFFSMVLADDEAHFSYGHLFAEAQIEVSAEHEDEEDLILPCVVSLFRERRNSQLEMTITSQDGQVDLHVKADNGNGPSWGNAEMRTKSHSIKMELIRNFNLIIRFEKDDFKTLWGMREYNKRVLDEWMAGPNERIIFATQLYDLNYLPPPGQFSPLPTNPIRGCALRLYERRSVDSQDMGTAAFSGHRIVIMTAPEVKTLSHISQVYDGNFPILHKYLRGDAQKPALMMQFLEKGKPASMIPSFMEDEDRLRFIDKLSSSYVASDEQILDVIPITNVTVSTSVPGTPANLLDIPGIQWQDINIVVKTADSDPFESGRFRITAHCKAGSLVDRPVVQPGEMKIGLDTVDMSSIRLRRSTNSSLTLSLMENSLPQGLTQPLQDAFSKKATAPSTVRYQFPSLQDLHKFQLLVTRHEVLYDGVCNAFSIKGQRTVGGLSKRMEATRARLQIIRDRGGLQLIAFFKDMPEGACMSFGIGSTDVYELSSVNSKYYVRLVDARFGIPKPLSEPDATFVSLDLPEFAGERDDILIGFDKEESRSTFVGVLPGSPSKASGLTTLKRLVEGGRPSSRTKNY